MKQNLHYFKIIIFLLCNLIVLTQQQNQSENQNNSNQQKNTNNDGEIEKEQVIVEKVPEGFTPMKIGLLIIAVVIVILSLGFFYWLIGRIREIQRLREERLKAIEGNILESCNEMKPDVKRINGSHFKKYDRFSKIDQLCKAEMRWQSYGFKISIPQNMHIAFSERNNNGEAIDSNHSLHPEIYTKQKSQIQFYKVQKNQNNDQMGLSNGKHETQTDDSKTLQSSLYNSQASYFSHIAKIPKPELCNFTPLPGDQ